MVSNAPYTFGSLLLPLLVLVNQPKEAYTHPQSFLGCDFFNDGCPDELQLNGACNDHHIDERAAAIPECYDADCFDCDPCHEFIGFCSACIASGCYYCPTNAVCSSLPLTQSYFDQHGIENEECPEVDDWSLTCSNQHPFVCDFNNDPCPWPMDAECDDINLNWRSPTIQQCIGGDCFDCDPCRAYRGDCTACVENGCYWCSGNAMCFSQPLDQAYFDRMASDESIRIEIDHLIVACPTVDSWQQSSCNAPNDNIFSDPLYDANRWSYQLLNVEPVWSIGITGMGVQIRINDDGVDINHPEFAGKFDVSGSCERYQPELFHDSHGTGTASIAAGNANNGHCAVGIAPDATISACNTLGFTADETEVLATGLDHVDVSSNSYGTLSCIPLTDRVRRLQQQCPFRQDVEGSPCQACDFSAPLTRMCESLIIDYCQSNYESDVTACIEFLDLLVDCEHNALSIEGQNALIRGVTEGRNGRGIVYLFSTGNDYEFGNDVNFEGWLNTRFTISVAAVDQAGRHASYSTPGAAVFITAPGGDYEYMTNSFGARPGGGCRELGAGTSYSCPAAAGVVALILQVNPDLTWRDVQGILAATAQKTDPENESWTTNAASFHHSNLFGFGLIDAFGAVVLANTWENWGSEQMLVAESGTVNTPIIDTTLFTTESTIFMDNSNGSSEGTLFTESVLVFLHLSHRSRGDLNIILTSPEGTQSILHPGRRPENQQLRDGERWKLMTVRAWGENPIGTWTLSIVDEREGDLDTCVDIPWEYVGNNFVRNATCVMVFFENLCSDGSVNFNDDFVSSLLDENGVSAVDACCACGGGRPASEVPDVLISWRLVVYSHTVVGGGPTISPTLSFTEQPTTGLGYLESKYDLKKVAPAVKCGSFANQNGRGGTAGTQKGCSSERKRRRDRSLLRGVKGTLQGR